MIIYSQTVKAGEIIDVTEVRHEKLRRKDQNERGPPYVCIVCMYAGDYIRMRFASS